MAGVVSETTRQSGRYGTGLRQIRFVLLFRVKNILSDPGNVIIAACLPVMAISIVTWLMFNIIR